MRNLNLEELAGEIIRTAQYEVELYGSRTNEILSGLPHRPELGNKQLRESLAYLQTIRRSNRFLSLAYSTLVSAMGLDAIDKDLASEFWLLHATLALNLNLPEIGRAAALKALEYLEFKESLELARAYSLHAMSSRNSGDYRSAITSYMQARRVAEELGDPELSTWQVFRLGKMYVNYLQQPSRGVEYLTNAHVSFRELGRQSALRGSAACLDQLGDVFRQATTNVTRAEKLYQEAMELNVRISNQRGVARNLAHLGSCAGKRRDYAAARNLLESSVRLTRAIVGEERGTAIRLGQLARVCVESEDASSFGYAQECLTEASDLCKRYREFKYMARHEIAWGLLHRRQRNFSSAKAHFTLAAELGRKFRLYEVEADAYDQLAELLAVDFQDYMRAQAAVIESAKVRMLAWNSISEGNPDLEEVENKIEIAFMYKSLFEKLLKDSMNDFDKSIHTIRQAYEIALKESQAKYENISRLLQVGALVSGIRHESLNLLNDIVSAISQIIKDTAIDKNVRRKLQAISEQSLMGLEILRGPVIQELLSSGYQGHEPAIAKAILPPVFEWIETGNLRLGITTVFCDEIPDVHVECDPAVLRLMIGSVVQNSRESFQDSGERIMRIGTMYEPADDRLSIEITDTGSGMDNQHIRMASQVGFTTKPGHTGLGIPTVEFLLQSMGGGLEISSRTGVGTVVRLLIPAKRVHG